MKRGSFHGIGVPDVGVVGVADGFDVEGVVNVGPLVRIDRTEMNRRTTLL